MSTTIDSFLSEPITEPVPVVRVGAHGRWTPLADSFTEWARSRRAAARWAAKHAAGVSAYHAARLPLYYLRVAQYAPHGTWKLSRGSWRWFTDADGRKAMRHTFEGDESFLRTRQQHREEIKARAFVSLVGATVLGGAAGFAWLNIPDAMQVPSLYALAGSMPLGLGLLGRPAGERAIQGAQLSNELRKLTHDEITAALDAMKIDVTQTRVGVVVTEADGWVCEIDLPRGMSAASIVKGKREDLAAALERPTGTVWPQVGPVGSPANRLVLRVSFKEMSQTEQQQWPLLAAERFNFFERFPLAQNELGQSINATLAGTNVAVGAMPGGGKTQTILLMLLAAALDPRTEMWVEERKGTDDYGLLDSLMSWKNSAPADEDEAVLRTVRMLRALDVECGRRARLVGEHCIEKKVTDVAAHVEGLHPLVVVLDECQVPNRHHKYGEEVVSLLTSIVERSRALGVTLILATQVPDRTSLPDSVMARVTTRWCGEQEDHIGTSATLGSGAWTAGIRPQFGLPGMGFLKGQHRTHQVGRTFHVPAADVARVVERALALRGGEVVKRDFDAEPQGHDQGVTPDGAPDGGPEEERTGPSRNLLADIYATKRTGETGVTPATLAERLREFDAAWQHIEADKLVRTLADIGIKKRKSQRVAEGVRPGYSYELDILPALGGEA